MKKIKILYKNHKTDLFKATLLNVFQFFLRGAPFGFLFMVMIELFAPIVDTQKIIYYLLSMLGVLVLNLILTYLSQMKLLVTSYEISGDIRFRLGDHLRKLSLGFFKRRDPGDITAPLLQDMKNVEVVFSHLYPDIIASIITPLTIAAIALYIDWRLTLISLGFILLAIPLLILAQRLIGKYAEKIFHSRTLISSRMIEYFLGMKEIKAHNMTGEKFKRLDSILDRFRKENIQLQAFAVPLLLTTMVVLEIGFIIVLLVGISYLFTNTITLPMFLIFLIIGNRFFDLIQGIGAFVTEMRYMIVGADRIINVLDEKPLPEPHAPEEVTKFDIEFSHVNFSYDQEEVLKNICLKIPENSLTALVGPSGSGKTTITNLIARFWDINAGEIRIGGTDIRKLSTEYLLSKISMIFQEVYLFNDTIFNNIKIGKPDAAEHEVKAAARAACCHEFISKMPSGYDSMVGEGGTKLSGGEKQRISIARAILKDAPIILLDEATVSLDPETEFYVQEAINHLIRSKTLIIIAHRLSTICHADHIIVLDKGRIQEQGKHEELLAAGGLYKHLWEIQKNTEGWNFTAK
jgi:ATP-binding cassette subfamily B protein IrtB